MGRHSTVVAFSFCTQPSWVRIWLLEKSNQDEKEKWMLFLITCRLNCSVLALGKKKKKKTLPSQLSLVTFNSWRSWNKSFQFTFFDFQEDSSFISGWQRCHVEDSHFEKQKSGEQVSTFYRVGSGRMDLSFKIFPVGNMMLVSCNVADKCGKSHNWG